VAVGCHGAAVTDLGTVSATEASQLMLAIARKGGTAAEDAILPAMLADSVTIWPDLIKLAKNPNVVTDVRKSAVFWVGQAAAVAATQGLVEVVGDAAVNRDVRESAVFALIAATRQRGSAGAAGDGPERQGREDPEERHLLARPVGGPEGAGLLREVLAGRPSASPLSTFHEATISRAAAI
jgi:hypothetical protein